MEKIKGLITEKENYECRLLPSRLIPIHEGQVDVRGDHRESEVRRPEAREPPMRDPILRRRDPRGMGGRDSQGLVKKKFGWTFANAKKEAGNDMFQTMFDAAYGYHGFERSRKRFLLMRWNKKR